MGGVSLKNNLKNRGVCLPCIVFARRLEKICMQGKGVHHDLAMQSRKIFFFLSQILFL